MNSETQHTEAALTPSDLRNFTGTEHYYRDPLTQLIFTDGVKYMAEKAGAYWLINAIGSHQKDIKLKKGRLADLQFWKLEVKPDNTAQLTCREDSGYKPAIVQNIEFTDFPFTIEIWVGRGEGGDRIAYLPSEH